MVDADYIRGIGGSLGCGEYVAARKAHILICLVFIDGSGDLHIFSVAVHCGHIRILGRIARPSRIASLQEIRPFSLETCFLIPAFCLAASLGSIRLFSSPLLQMRFPAGHRDLSCICRKRHYISSLLLLSYSCTAELHPNHAPASRGSERTDVSAKISEVYRI